MQDKEWLIKQLEEFLVSLTDPKQRLQLIQTINRIKEVKHTE